jgi:hypothetical protein
MKGKITKEEVDKLDIDDYQKGYQEAKQEFLKMIDSLEDKESCKEHKLDNKEDDCLQCYTRDILKELKSKLEKK